MTYDRLVYALSKSHDFEVFQYLILNDNIDEELKVTVIEDNLYVIIRKINSDMRQEELECILTSMKIFPVTEVGKALEKYYSHHNAKENMEVLHIIEYIQHNGVEGVFKSDKE